MRGTLGMALWAACTMWSFGARAEVVRLLELEAKAISNRPALRREGARTRVAEAEMRKAASAYYPQFALKADGSVGPGRQLLRVEGDKSTDPSYRVSGSAPLTGKNRKEALLPSPRGGVELSASASLYDFGRTQAATAAGREGHAAALEGRALTEAELRYAVRESYLNWLLSSELLRLAEGALHEATARRQRVAALITEGLRPKGELTPARADELLAELEHQRAERDLGAARLSLEQAVGAPLLAAAEPDRALFSAEAKLPNRSDHDGHSRRALLGQYKAAQAQATAQATLNRPQLGIGLSAGVRVSRQSVVDINNPTDPRSKGTVFPLYTAGLTLNVPLWDGGFTRAGVDAALARVEQAKADLDEFENERAFTQRRAELDAQSALTRLETAEELVSVCADRLKDAEDGYELGASSIDLISQARGLLRRAQTEELLARADHAAARLHMVQRDRP